MKTRYSLTLLLLATSAFVVTTCFFPITQAKNKKSIKFSFKTEQLEKAFQAITPIDPKTLTEAQKAIPDEVAFEVFLRTVGENNAKQLLLNVGFDEYEDSGKIEQIMGRARLYNNLLENLDKQAREIKISKNGGRNFLDDAKVKNDLARLQTEKANVFQQVIAPDLRKSAESDSGWQKLENYVRTKVKSQMQVVEIKSSLRSKPQKEKKRNVALVKSFAERSAVQTQVGNAYLYVTGWHDGENVFGSGMITEQYTSETSYLVTANITSPSGRSNTTSDGWYCAALSNSTGLSIGFEDGTYDIQVNFDADLGGYYDEWGNYYSYGSYPVGSLTATVSLLPRVGVRAMRITPASGNNNTVNSSTAKIQADISFDTGFPSIPVRINLNRLSNPSSVAYNLGATVRNGTIVNNTNNRGVVVTPDPGDAVTVEWDVTFTNNSPGGNVTESVRIDPSQFQSNTVVVNPEEAQLPFVYVTPSPTPSPTPNPTPTPPIIVGGGGCSCGWAGLGCAGCANYGTYGFTNNGCASGFFNQYGCCCFGSPIVIDVDGNGYAMTNNASGVWFDLGGDGVKDKTSWTTANSDDAWLVLDRNNNNRIDDGKEMFGNYCDQPPPPPGVLRNGFIGLAEFDKATAGGNGDGRITRSDAVFRRLRLWQDRNHNGISEPEELSKLPALDIVALDLDYKESNRTDEYGNRFKYRAKVRDARGARAGRWAWDVFTLPPQ